MPEAQNTNRPGNVDRFYRMVLTRKHDKNLAPSIHSPNHPLATLRKDIQNEVQEMTDKEKEQWIRKNVEPEVFVDELDPRDPFVTWRYIALKEPRSSFRMQIIAQELGFTLVEKLPYRATSVYHKNNFTNVTERRTYEQIRDCYLSNIILKFVLQRADN